MIGIDAAAEIVRNGRNGVDNFAMGTNEPIDNDVDEPFNGAELSESVLGRDWSSPEEEAAWSNL